MSLAPIQNVKFSLTNVTTPRGIVWHTGDWYYISITLDNRIAVAVSAIALGNDVEDPILDSAGTVRLWFRGLSGARHRALYHTGECLVDVSFTIKGVYTDPWDVDRLDIRLTKLHRVGGFQVRVTKGQQTDLMERSVILVCRKLALSEHRKICVHRFSRRVSRQYHRLRRRDGIPVHQRPCLSASCVRGLIAFIRELPRDMRLVNALEGVFTGCMEYYRLGETTITVWDDRMRWYQF